jgi:hypothetical protein
MPQEAFGQIGMSASSSSSSSAPFITTDIDEHTWARPKVMMASAETQHVEQEIAAWASNRADDQAKASKRTVEIRRRMQEAATRDLALLENRTAVDNLYNPALLELPASWRRPGEKWLAVFREKQESTENTAQADAQWYSFSLVLAVLDGTMRPTRPASKLRSEDLFDQGGFDCQLLDTDTAYFGPADARLFLNPGGQGRGFEVLLFFTARGMAAEPNTPCPAHGGQRMYMARVNSNLTAGSAGPLLVPGEEEPLSRFVSGPQNSGIALHEGGIAGVGHLSSTEKNWAPFAYLAPKISNVSLGAEQSPWMAAQVLVEYMLEPHVIMNLETSSRRLGDKQVWKTSSSVVQAWLARRNAEYSQTHNVVSAADIHGGVGALLMQAYVGRPKVFVSVLHVRFTDKKGEQAYHSYVYTFEAEPPFRILGVSEKELPLVRRSCRWGAAVAFPMSLAWEEGPSGAVLQLSYGSGDSEARRLLIPSTELGSFLPARHDLEPGQPGLTLVMMSHSRARFQDLKDILAHYRAMNQSLLEEIILVWNDPQDLGAMEELRLLNNDEGVPLQVVSADVNSMNNRFAVWKLVSTEGVIIQDDDMWLDEAGLTCLVHVWRAEPGRLVGASSERSHLEHDAMGHFNEMSPKCDQASYVDRSGNTIYGNDTYCRFWGEEYSMLLPHPWVLSKKYLQSYTELSEATELVDSMHNCDDIYLNAVVANHTRVPPVAVEVPVHRYPTWMDASAMWVSDRKWKEHRGQCLERVNAYYIGEPMSPDTGTVFRMARHSLSCPASVA